MPHRPPPGAPGPDATVPLTSGRLPQAPSTVRGFRLDVEEGPSVGAHWESADSRCAIGSHPSCQLVLDDDTVSRFHCEVVMDEGGARVRDLDSRNGTEVDGTRVLHAFLRGDSRLHLGRSVVRFRFQGRRVHIPLAERTSFGVLVGQSTAMRATFALLEKAAARDVKVLLEGETGTGKSAAARSVHSESARRDAPFVRLNCGAIPAPLLESELFGHVKGAFTGALDRPGAFEAADGGTIFLDEIGEMPLDMQVKLLTVLDDQAVRRVGSNQARPIDVRVIAATNRDLRTEVNAGHFREDLYYRLAVLRVRMPALRERPEDLPVLARSLLADLARPGESFDHLLTEELIDTLRRAAWPGNIRELGNYLEQCMVFDAVQPLDMNGLDSLDGDPDAADVHRDDDAARTRIEVAPDLPFSAARKRALADFERVYIAELMRRNQGKITQAADAAGIDRTYLYRLRQRYGI
ncbi:sigma 54-interacting transcriptional regulator [Haliangium sp.]|uniref:sigma 54-interacting transcriptional regulator n=1 Tax=Haliangium sp. TaxID=2663208 RepID=UPI003D0D509A